MRGQQRVWRRLQSQCSAAVPKSCLQYCTLCFHRAYHIDTRRRGENKAAKPPSKKYQTKISLVHCLSSPQHLCPSLWRCTFTWHRVGEPETDKVAEASWWGKNLGKLRPGSAHSRASCTEETVSMSRWRMEVFSACEELRRESRWWRRENK